MSDDFVDAPPAGADAWRELWQRDRRYHPRPSKYEWLLQRLRRLFRRAMEPDAERQQNFNVALLDLFDDIRSDIAALRNDLKGDIAAVQSDVRAADEALAGDVKHIRELIPVAAKRNDALIAALDQKIETLAVRIRDVVNPVSGGQAPRLSGQAGAPVLHDFIYRRIEDGLRGSEHEVRGSFAPYAELAKSHAPLFDVGCGRGELLALCRDIEARGCDTNERSVADLKQRGFDVVLAGVPECFANVAGGSLGSIAALHVVEHLPVEALFALFAHAARALRSGGLLMIETPNAESLLMSGSEFWRDPTHLAPRHPAALTLLAREYGFDIDEIRAIHDWPEGTKIPGDSPLIEAINARLFAPQDLRLILRRR